MDPTLVRCRQRSGPGRTGAAGELGDGDPRPHLNAPAKRTFCRTLLDASLQNVRFGETSALRRPYFGGYRGGAGGTLTSKPAMTASMSGASSAAFSAYPVTVNWIR